jgi:hypothetical protein
MKSKEYEEELSENYYGNPNQSCIILLERNLDFSSAILHPWHYGALIHDLMEIKNNKVEMNNELTNHQSTRIPIFLNIFF